MKTSKNNTTTWYVDNINGIRQSITYNEEVWENINLNEIIEDKKIKNNNKKQNIKKNKCCSKRCTIL
ncbi:hypothetical protein [Spiroplasma ixodetis]|uniref:hypothetical protein n=1 Tax=Spiroplasma ixodetis TaxID=2141 RepID=UPI002576118B|nr:hypothetical protein [Spiroplasma ixodetis]WJG71093.1 hypothetical protein SIXOD_v1c24340 [Spiroplasma ixodetis Y32]